MQTAISASKLVNIQPGVISGGSAAVQLSAVMITKNPALVSNVLTAFSSAKGVTDFFGSTSVEAQLATIYFGGFDNSNIKPSVVYFANYNDTANSAFLRSAKITTPLATVKTSSGDISVTVDGTVKTATGVTLSSATSFADVASQLSTALGLTVSYDSQLAALTITSATTGTTSTLDYATGTLADLLGSSSQRGAVLSATGAEAQIPATMMTAIAGNSQNWVSFMTAFEPDYATKLAFADWANAQNQRFAYVLWDSDAQATQLNSNCIGATLQANNYDSVILVYPDAKTATLICGTIASIDFTEHNGRIPLAYRGQAGMVAQATNEQIANNLIANGYNFYGAYATATTRFTMIQPGQITGRWKWIDSFVNQVYLNASLQQAIIEMLVAAKSVPYNADGYGMIHAACLDPITAAINFGSIRKGIPLSNSQAMQVNQAAGKTISGEITETGYYLQILAASSITRTARQSPPMAFWYTDGESIQQINLPSINVM